MRCPALMLAALSLFGCVNFEDEAQRTYSRTGGFSTAAAFTTADARIVIERRNPVTGQPVVCTEPSPDVAKALSTAVALSGQGGDGTAKGALAFSAGSAEAAAELAGRTTALLGLRDGLYRACEAYANGVIGADAYAIILSRYSQLMTTLFLGQDIAGATAAAAKAAAVQSPPVTTTASTPNVAVSVTTPTATGAAPGTPAAPAAGAAALARMNEDYFNLDYDRLHLLVIACVNQNDPTSLAGRQPSRWLQEICVRLQNLVSPDQLAALAKIATRLVHGRVLAPPVDPMAATAPPPPAAKQPTAKKALKVP